MSKIKRIFRTSFTSIHCTRCTKATFRVLVADLSATNVLEDIKITCIQCNLDVTSLWSLEEFPNSFADLAFVNQKLYYKGDVPDTLQRILNNAHAQSMKGKGIERHGATGKTFDEQQIVSFGVTTKSINYNIGQGNKKILEALNLPPAKAIHELLGAINYIAGAIAIQEKLHPEVLANDSDLMKGGLYNK